jgi:NADH-quinone oxidoreductase subunit L
MLFKLTVFLPLLGFIACGALSRFVPNNHQDKHQQNFSDKFAQIFTTLCLFISLICALLIFADVYKNKTSYNHVLLSWIASGDFIVNWSLKLDSLTAVMLVVVVGVSFLVHLYSIAYMHEDRSIARFMSYLSLFTFFMLMLVSADNFVQLFFGWEGVGVASYLLIGFWFKKQSANVAAMKAFIVNRVGDFGLIFAIALIYLNFGTLEYEQVFAQASNHLQDRFSLAGIEFVTIDWICILLFIGAMGKSAQLGLHVWLADAMEGPTPVSALIHAATMVTAGVFLVIRCSPLFELSPIALNFVTIVGALTAFFSATIALTQNDIKKIIAYSTCSQLGYMFFACGLSAYSPAIFHLATHAFFKALLFLSAGSVIHAMHHEQDIRKMGGIYKKIPFTYAMMWIGSLALAGFWPFAGFYSKDTILESAFMSHSPYAKLAFVLGLASAFLTAFYSWRLLFLTFHGKTRANRHTFDHAHESPKLMLIPLAVLAIGSIIAGYFGANYFNMISAENNFFSDSIFVATQNEDLLNEIHHTPTLVKLSPMLLSIVAIALAYWFYVRNTDLSVKLAKKFSWLYNFSFNKWYFDELYEIIFTKPARRLGDILWRIIDVKIVDGIPNSLALLCKFASQGISKIQTGFIYNYALWMVLGVVGILLFLVMSLKSLV